MSTLGTHRSPRVPPLGSDPVGWATTSRESGEVVLWQAPNRLALLSTAGAALTVVAPAGSPVRRAAAAMTAVVATWWGADELARGVNPFRRAVGGAAVLAIAGARAVHLRSHGALRSVRSPPLTRTAS